MDGKIGRPRKYVDTTASQIRLPSEVFSKLKTIAAKEGRSMNGQLTYWIQREISAYETKYGQIENED